MEETMEEQAGQQNRMHLHARHMRLARVCAWACVVRVGVCVM